jgi:hypothetical protein
LRVIGVPIILRSHAAADYVSVRLVSKVHRLQANKKMIYFAVCAASACGLPSCNNDGVLVRAVRLVRFSQWRENLSATQAPWPETF